MDRDYKLYNFMDMSELQEAKIRELGTYLIEWGLKDPETSLILGNVRRICGELLAAQREEERADWLRSEIEKLDVEYNDIPKRFEHPFELAESVGQKMTITSIITRYKEELKVLESK